MTDMYPDQGGELPSLSEEELIAICEGLVDEEHERIHEAESEYKEARSGLVTWLGSGAIAAVWGSGIYALFKQEWSDELMQVSGMLIATGGGLTVIGYGSYYLKARANYRRNSIHSSSNDV